MLKNILSISAAILVTLFVFYAKGWGVYVLADRLEYYWSYVFYQYLSMCAMFFLSGLLIGGLGLNLCVYVGVSFIISFASIFVMNNFHYLDLYVVVAYVFPYLIAPFFSIFGFKVLRSWGGQAENGD